MPQTREALAHSRAAGCPIVVAITKVDLPSVRPALQAFEGMHGLNVLNCMRRHAVCWPRMRPNPRQAPCGGLWAWGRAWGGDWAYLWYVSRSPVALTLTLTLFLNLSPVQAAALTLALTLP